MKGKENNELVLICITFGVVSNENCRNILQILVKGLLLTSNQELFIAKTGRLLFE